MMTPTNRADEEQERLISSNSSVRDSISGDIDVEIGHRDDSPPSLSGKPGAIRYNILRRIPRSRIGLAISLIITFFVGFVVFDELAFLDKVSSIQVLGGFTAREGVKDIGKPLEWSKEEIALSNWTWGPFPPHDSLVGSLSSLSSSELRTRNWLLAMRTARILREDYSVGIGRQFTHEIDLDKRSLTSSWLWKIHPSAPESFQSGDLKKYENLVEEWKSGQPVSVCQKGNWEDDYQKLHGKMMSGEIEAKLLTGRCDRGGLADRLFGVVSAFLYAIVTNRAFSVQWTYPIPFSLAFDSPHIDWSYPYTESLEALHPIYGNQSLKSKLVDYNLYNLGPPNLDAFIPHIQDWLSDSKQWVRAIINRGLVFRSFRYPEVSPRLAELGIYHDTAFACLARYLMRPRPAVMNYINTYSSFFALPSIYSIGIHIRTGDKSMDTKNFPDYDALNTVERHKAYFDCAHKVGKRFAKPGQKIIYFLISDSHHLKEEALRVYGDSLVTSSLGVAHVNFAYEEMSPQVGMMNSIAEMWTFGETDFQVITMGSGFGKFATWLKSKPNSTIPIFPKWNENVNGGNLGKTNWEPDCSSPDSTGPAIQEILENEWSLG